jgi:hypothetical protein
VLADRYGVDEIVWLDLGATAADRLASVQRLARLVCARDVTPIRRRR